MTTFRPVIIVLLAAAGAVACTVERPEARPPAATPTPSVTPSATPAPSAALCTKITQFNAALVAYQRDATKNLEPQYTIDPSTLRSEVAATARVALALRPMLPPTARGDLDIVMNAMAEVQPLIGSTQLSRLLDPVASPASRGAWRRLVEYPGCS